MDDKDEYLFRFIGYGDLKSPLWFVGIEEAGAQGKPPRCKEHVCLLLPSGSYRYDPKLPKTNEARLWRKYQTISERAGNGSNFFMSNMAPLARSGINEKLIGIDFASYRNQVRQRRIPALRELIEQFRPRAVIFHGSTAWRDYRVRESFGVDVQEERVQCYPEHRLLFTCFLTQGFSNHDQDRVVGILIRWLDAPR